MSADISSPEIVCLQCGDIGFANAFVYCVKCLEFAVHRYCLDVIPETVDEFVRWICDDCDVKFQKRPSVPKHNSVQCHSIDRTSDHIIGHPVVGTTENNLVAVNNVDEGGPRGANSAPEREPQCENNSSERPHEEGTDIEDGNKLDLRNNSSERLHEEGINIDVSHCSKSVSDSDFRVNNDSAMQIDRCETDSDPCTVDQRDKTVNFQLPEENKVDSENQRSEDRKSEASEKEQCGNNSSERLHEEGINIDVSHCAKSVSDSDFRENNDSAMQIDRCETDFDPCTVDQRDKTVNFRLPEENKVDSENQRSEDRISEVSQKEQCGNNSSERLHEEGTNIDVSHCAKSVSDSDFRENNDSAMQKDQCETDSDPCTVDRRDKTFIFQLPEESKVDSENERSEDRKSEVSEERTSNDVDVSSKVDEENKVDSENQRSKDRKSEVSQKEQCENNSSERLHEEGTNIDVSHCAKSVSDSDFRENNDSAMHIDQCETDFDPCTVDQRDKTVIFQLPEESKVDSENQRSEDRKSEVSEGRTSNDVDVSSKVDEENKVNAENQRSEDRKSEVSQKEQCENNSSERLHEEGTNIDVSHCAKSVSDPDFRENNDSAMQIDQCETDSDPCTVDQRDNTVIFRLPEENKVNSENQRSEDRKSDEKEQCENNSSERLHEEGTNIDVSHCAKSVSDSDFRENNDSAMQIDQCETVIFQLPEENKVDSENQRSEDRKSEVSEERTSIDVDVSSKVDEENKVDSENQRSEDRKSEVSEERTSNDVDVSSKVDEENKVDSENRMSEDRKSEVSEERTSNDVDVSSKVDEENKVNSENQRSEDRKSEVSEERTSNDVDVSSKVDDCHILSEPVIMPVWRGSFDIRNRKGYVLDELMAHMSSRACQKVYEEACLFEPVLHLEILPKSDVWPKSFEKSESVENNIALYFFPSDIRNERVYEQLVDEMVHKALAMRAIVQNAELLVFASTELPTLYWRFQGGYYLWGVFRAKQNRAPCSQSYKEESKCNNPVINTDLPEDSTGFSWDMMTTSNPLAIVLDRNRLNGTNYADWKRNLKLVLTLEDLTHVLNEEPPQLPADNATQEVKDAYKSWFDHDSRAKRYILASVEDRFHNQRHSLSTSKDVMSDLKEMIILENFLSIQNAMSALTCKMPHGARVGDHVVKMIGYIDELENLGAEMEKEIKMDPVLFSLPKAFNQFVLNVGKKNCVMTLFEVRDMLQRAKDWIKKDENVAVVPEVVVGEANKKRKRNNSGNKENPKQGSSKKRAKNKDQSKDSCFHCGKKGHWRRNCREYMASRNN